MPISPRPPSGGGRPWSSTAIPPAYRRKRIANCERSIPLLTTRGYPLVLGDKIPMRPLSCVPGHHSTPVLAPPRPASSASVPMKATIKENTFKELVKYWEKTTLEKAKSPSSLIPAVKDAILHNKTTADADTADAFPEGDMPHNPVNLVLFEEAILCNKATADMNTADVFPGADVPHKTENLLLFGEYATLHNKTTTEVDTADVFPEADVPHKTENLPLNGEYATVCNKATTDMNKADVFPGADVPHKTENLLLFGEYATLHNKTTTEVDTADVFPEADVPHKTENLPLNGEYATVCNKATTDMNTADVFPGADVPHKTENIPMFGEYVTLHNKTTTEVDTADVFPEADVPHKTENLPMFGEEATLCSKGNLLQPDIHAGAIQNHLNEENPDMYDVADVHHEPKGFPCRSVEIPKKEIRVARYQDLSISRIGSPLPENIEIDLRRARTLDQHLASVKQKVAENTAHDEWHRINELQHRMDVVDNIFKEISEKVKFVNKEMMDIESESFLINSKKETPRCMNTKEKEPPSDFQTQSKLPPIPIRAKQTPKIPTMNHLSDHTTKINTSSSQIVKSSCLPRQMETKALPAIFPQKGKFDPVVRSPHMSTQRKPQTDIDNEYKQLQRAMDRVGRNLGPTPLKEHIRYHEHETGRPPRRPRNEQDKIPCRGKSKETKSETGFKEKPNQRKRNRNRQKKKKIEKAPIKIEDRPPFSAEVKPSKYFSDMSRLSDAS